MVELKKKIEEIAEPVVVAHNAFLVDVSIRQGGQRKRVQIFADTDIGITIYECAEISRELSKLIDEQDLIHGAFDLEVSSPGLDNPIRLLRQYAKNIGRSMIVKYHLGNEMKTIEGKLEAIQGSQIELSDSQNEHLHIEFSQIIESRVKLPW